MRLLASPALAKYVTERLTLLQAMLLWPWGGVWPAVLVLLQSGQWISGDALLGSSGLPYPSLPPLPLLRADHTSLRSMLPR